MAAYLHNAWYVAAWPEQVTRTLLRRVFLDQPIVLFRREDGTPAALADSCPHRFVPLSRGALVGDDVECCYHGLRFDSSGACTLNPHGDGTIPRTAYVRPYPLAERHGLIWIWMGAADRADPAGIPDLAIPNFPALGDTGRYAAVTGTLHIEANYQLITDNLLDLSHAQFLHPGLRVANARVRNEMKQVGRDVIAYFWRDAGQPNGLMQLLGWPLGTMGDSRAHMHWHAPSLLVLDVGATGVGRPVEEGIMAPSLHLLTPETARTTHYFFGFLRLVRIGDVELDERLRSLGMQAFAMEDKPVIEAQQRQLGDADIMALNPALLSPDAAGVRVRRVLQSMLEAEARETLAAE